MSTPSDFRLVLRGYEPAQVESRVRGLEEEIARLRADQPSLRAATPSPEPATYEHLGRRMMHILDLATEEADALRAAVRAEVETTRADSLADAVRLAGAAELEAEQIRADAQAEAAGTTERARLAAADLLDAAAREAAIRRREAEGLLERQREAVAHANDEFERSMTQRREDADRRFREAEAEYRSRLDALGRRVAAQHAEVEEGRSRARQEARDIIEAAQAQAASLVEQARATATELTAAADREVEVAARRRDDLAHQLADLREMLASLTAQTPGREDATAP